MNGQKQKLPGGYDNYSLKSSTMIEGYFPGPMRSNILLDPHLAIGKVDPGTFGSDQWYNGPGTLLQALPDASRFQSNQIFAVPRGNPYKEFGVDDRQVASYQVEQLRNNPLSQYTTNPNGSIPGFECVDQPDSYSSMVNKRENEYKKYFESGDGMINNGMMPSIDVYEQYTGKKVNPNAEVVYNLSLNSKEDVNPMIALGSSSVARTQADFSGKCYSGQFIPGYTIGQQGGNNPPAIYGEGYMRPRTEIDQGFMNRNTNTVCVADKSMKFANPLILNPF
jgi:hypothetical protein